MFWRVFPNIFQLEGIPLSCMRLSHSISPGGREFLNLMEEGDGSADDVVSEVS